MPSRKRAKGKARKALARVTQNDGQHVRTNPNRRSSVIDFEKGRDENGGIMCHHGCSAPSWGDVCGHFLVQFATCLKSSFGKVKEMPGKIPHLRAIACFTIIIGYFEKRGLLEVCKDESQRPWIRSYLTTLGTHHLLQEEAQFATLAFTNVPHYEMAATIALCLLKV